MAVDFSHGTAVRDHVIELAGRRMNVVIGTTGWQADEAIVKGAATSADIGVLAAANFSLGMMVFRAAVEAAAASSRPSTSAPGFTKRTTRPRRTRRRARP